MAFDVYTLMYVIFAVLGLSLAYVVAGQRIRRMISMQGKKSGNAV